MSFLAKWHFFLFRKTFKFKNMKITKIDITEYQQFKNFVLDLTYPEGHAKAGQPLDKVCFIGQSGTGKTTLLNLIANFVENTYDFRKGCDTLFPINSSFSIHSEYAKFVKQEKKQKSQILYLYKDEKAKVNEYVSPSELMSTVKPKKFIFHPSNLIEVKGLIKKYLLYISADILSNYQYFIKPKKDEKPLIGLPTNSKKISEVYPTTIEHEKNLKIDNNTKIDIWKYVFKEIDIFEEKVEEKNKELFRKLSTKDAQKTFEEFIQWKAAQKNPREELANKLAEILSLFQLEIDAEDTDNYLTVRAKNESGIIPSEGISTGTKSLILTTALLWGIGLDNTVVLFDEPERSLYPNVQRKLVDFYTEISPSSQYFFATHSPVIAASFEPWEIVELDFDENGYVFQKLYYEGERKIDNYFTDFRYLRWDDILMKGFGLMEEGNSFFRERELTKMLRLKKQLEKLRTDNQIDTELYQQKLAEYLSSARKLGWTNEKD